MRVTIAEQFSMGKLGPGRPNDDGIAIGPFCFAVVDGATAKGNQRFDGKLSGEFAKDVVCAELHDTRATDSAQDLVNRLSSKLNAEVLRVTGAPAAALAPAFRPTASFVAFLPIPRQLVFVGDCLALMDGAPLSFSQVLEPTIAQVRASYFAELKAQGIPDSKLIQEHQPGARKVIAPIIHFAASLSNLSGHPLSFSVIDGTPVPCHLVHTVAVPTRVTSLVLSSDGYPELFATLDKTETNLKTLLVQDPLCIAELSGCKGLEPGNVSYDDRTYLSLTLV